MKIEIIDVSNVDFKAIPRLPYVSLFDWNHIGSCYFRSEERWLGSVDMEIACIWGLIPPSLLSDRAYLWLFHTDLVEQHKLSFVRHSQIQMQRMLKSYPIIVGDCMVSNTMGRRWLKWLGAEFGYPGGELVPFEIRAKAYG